MTIEIETEKRPQWPFDIQEVTSAVIEGTADCEQCPYEIEVQILLTDNAGIQELNREHRGIDKATDVLSFPVSEFTTPSAFAELEADENMFAFHPESGELMLGDIVISVDKVREQAEAYGHSEKREYAFLLVHSMLHLFGYDHIEEEDRILMEKRQKEILKYLEISRQGE